MSGFGQLKVKFDSLESRERKLLSLGIIVGLVFLIYTLFYRPITDSIAQLQKSNLSNQQLLVWMKQSAAKMKRSSGKGKNTDKRRGRSLNVIINTTASTAKISISRSQPRDNKQYQIWLDKVVFNELLLWLNILQKDYGIFVSTINLGTTDNTGLVRVNLIFQDSGS